jgi:hypothetical protein
VPRVTRDERELSIRCDPGFGPGQHVGGRIDSNYPFSTTHGLGHRDERVVRSEIDFQSSLTRPQLQRG